MKFVNNTYRIIVGLSLISLLFSCVEEIEVETDTVDDILIVEGIITNELKQQEVRLSRLYELNENEPNPVNNAKVTVSNANGEVYVFSLDSSGIYKSNSPFRIQLGVNYELHVETASGKKYKSFPVKTDTQTEIGSIQSSKEVVSGEEGVAITIDNEDSGSENSYYKFEYIETYEIRSPYEKRLMLAIDENDSVVIVPKIEQDYICYPSKKSNNIIISNTANLASNELNNFLVRFIAKDDYELAYRYSILVKQLEISAEAYEYYNTLKNLSESESVFSQYQPGFLNGNIQSENPNDRVLGYFTTASVDESRLFFSYEDYFSAGNTRPTHIAPCTDRFLPSKDLLRELYDSGEAVFFDEPNPGIIVVIRPPQCIDCRYFGPNVKPDFWID